MPDRENYLALVLLQAKCPALNDVLIRDHARQALGVHFDLNDPQATTFVMAFPSEYAAKLGPGAQSFLVKLPSGMFLVNCAAKSYFNDPAAVTARYIDMRLQRIITEHAAWITVDLLESFAADHAREEAYRVIGKLLATFIDKDTLGIYCPESQKCREIDEQAVVLLSGDDPLKVFERSAEPPVINIDENDPRLQEAIAEARHRLRDFVHVFHTHTAVQSGFSIKAKFEHRGTAEFMWVGVTEITGETITGILGNKPNRLSHLNRGDLVTIPVADVVDWLYLDGEQMVGAYSVAVLEEIARAGKQ